MEGQVFKSHPAPAASLPVIGYHSKLLPLSRLTLTVCFCPELRRGDFWVLPKPRSQRKGSETVRPAGLQFGITSPQPIGESSMEVLIWAMLFCYPLFSLQPSSLKLSLFAALNIQNLIAVSWGETAGDRKWCLYHGCSVWHKSKKNTASVRKIKRSTHRPRHVAKSHKLLCNMQSFQLACMNW